MKTNKEIKETLKRAFDKCSEMLGGRNNHDAEQRIDEILLIYSDLFDVSINDARGKLERFKPSDKEDA